MKSNIHKDRETRRKQTLENANSGEVRDFTLFLHRRKDREINNRFCYYWNPEDDRDNKDVIIIEDNVTGYYETNYPRLDKAQIMKMNHNMGLSDNEVYEICQCNCKIIFANEPTGVMEKLRNRRERKQ